MNNYEFCEILPEFIEFLKEKYLADINNFNCYYCGHIYKTITIYDGENINEYCMDCQWEDLVDDYYKKFLKYKKK